MQDIIVLGVGGNAIDIAEAVQASSLNGANCQIAGFLDDNASLWGKTVAGQPVLGGLPQAVQFPSATFINGIGSPENFWQKRTVVAKTGLASDRFGTIIHPTAWVSPSAKLGRGVAVLANATIGANTEIGDHVIVLPNAVISHDDTVGDFGCIASGACLSGNVVVAGGSYLGSRCVVRGHVRIGAHVLVGMGAVVLTDVPDNHTVVGNPARFLRNTNA